MSSSSDEVMSSDEEEKIKKSRLSKASSSEEAEPNDGEEEEETSENATAANVSSDFRAFTQTQSDDDEEDEVEDNVSQLSDKVEDTDLLKVKSDSEAEAEPSPTQEDLFGDADDVSTDSKEDDENKQAEEITERQNSFAVDDEQEEIEEVPETLIDVEIPKINVDLGNQIHFVKFPNFLSVEPRPFDADTYEDEIDDDDVLDEEGRSRVKLKVENTIRWKNCVDDDGNPIKKSNAKVVRWSDGSMSLYLGAEVFDVHMHPLQGDHHHLFIRQGTGLQGRAIFRTKLTFRPHSTESFTHRKMTMSMADRTSKTQKVKVLPVVGKDPEAQKLELLKKEEERLRASARRESQQRRNRDRAHGRGLSASYLEPDRGESDEEENTVSLSAIKRSFKSGGARDYAKNLYDSDDGSDASDTKAKEKLEQAKRLDSDDDEQGSPGGDDKKKRRANMIEEDSEDDD